MSLTYLNTQEGPGISDNLISGVPGKYFIFPSSIMIHKSDDINPNLIVNTIIEDPQSFATFMHEYMHYLSIFATSTGHGEVFLQQDIIKHLFGTNGLIRMLTNFGWPLSRLPLPVVDFVVSNPKIFSPEIVEKAESIKTLLQMFNLINGTIIDKTLILKWPFATDDLPMSRELVPEPIGVALPHSGMACGPFQIGSRIIHEGWARTTELRTLGILESVVNKQDFESIYRIRDEQPIYQVSRSYVFGNLEQRTKLSNYTQMSLWHNLICDLSLMGPNPVTLENDWYCWREVHPGLRFVQLVDSAVHFLNTHNEKWDLQSYSKDQYLFFADELLNECNFDNYEQSCTSMRADLDNYIRSSTESFVLEYHNSHAIKATRSKSRFPHLMSNPNLVNQDNVTQLLEGFGLPRIIIANRKIIAHNYLNIGPAFSLDEVFIAMHLACLASQVLVGRSKPHLECFNSYFSLVCEFDNGHCSKDVSVRPDGCPFAENMDSFGLEI